jgi:hypothetical protein
MDATHSLIAKDKLPRKGKQAAQIKVVGRNHLNVQKPTAYWLAAQAQSNG